MENLKTKKIVLTPQRIAVWDFIKENKKHPSADMVYESVKVHFPSMSFATVYSILETFCDAGLLKELTIRKDKTCFDPFIDSHHHLLCKVCNKIYDVEIKCKNSKFCEVDGHKIETVHGYFYGICKNCQKKEVK
jgi:Fur family peroxide stress response transcriptional regulator